MFFDAAVQALRCPYCGTLETAGARESLPIREIPIDEGLARAARGMGRPVTSVQCTTCGAVVHAAEGEVTAACTFCGSAVVLYQTDPNLIRPESLVPFLFDRNSANQRFASWLKGLWFRPDSLKRLSRADKLEGVYVPFWTFDASVHSTWTADAGHYYYETEHYTETVGGKKVQRSRQVRHTRWERASGSRDDRYDDILVCASRGLGDALVRKLSPFDTQRLVPYDPSFLAGWRAEAYSIDIYAGLERGKETIVTGQRGRCSRDVPGDTQRALDVENTMTAVTFKHVLLPVWVGVFRHDNRPYQFMVNGQTGEVVGTAPWSTVKILFSVLIVPVALMVSIFVMWFLENYEFSF